MENLAKDLEPRSFRRFVKNLFSSWVKRQSYDSSEEFLEIRNKIQELAESIEILAKEVARQGRRRK